MKNRPLSKEIQIDIYEATIKDYEEKLSKTTDPERKKLINFYLNEYREFLKKIKNIFFKKI
jgi:hypothetical protein